MIRAGLMRWLEGPPLTGPNALACLAAAIAIPTLIRAAVDGVVTGCEFTPYLPFVIVFSLENDEVWASWYGEGPPLRLGSQQRVSRMMKDFLRQEEVGKRLNRRP